MTTPGQLDDDRHNQLVALIAALTLRVDALEPPAPLPEPDEHLYTFFPHEGVNAQRAALLTWSAFQNAKGDVGFDTDIMEDRIPPWITTVFGSIENAAGKYVVIDIEPWIPGSLGGEYWKGHANLLIDAIAHLRTILPDSKILIYVVPWRVPYHMEYVISPTKVSGFYEHIAVVMNSLHGVVDGWLCHQYDFYADGQLQPGGESWVMENRCVRPMQVALDNAHGKPVFAIVSHRYEGKMARNPIGLDEFRTRLELIMSVRGPNGEKAAGVMWYYRDFDPLAADVFASYESIIREERP